MPNRANMTAMDCADLEGIARDIHSSTGDLLPVDAFKLAALCGLTLVPSRRAEGLLELEAGAIHYPSRARLVRQHGVIAHELGHWALYQAGEDHRVEWGARYLAGALLLPRTAFTRDLEACDWDLDALRALHPNASAEMTIVRMTQVSAATAWVWDDGAVRRTYGARSNDDVSDIIDRVLASETPQRDGDVGAWPLLERGFRRVLVVRRAA